MTSGKMPARTGTPLEQLGELGEFPVSLTAPVGKQMTRPPSPIRQSEQPWRYAARLVDVARHREGEVMFWATTAERTRGRKGREEALEQLRRNVARPPELVWLRAVLAVLTHLEARP